MAEVKLGEYKGHKTIGLPMDEGGVNYFTFGIRKAKIILEYIDEIKKFVEENETE